MIMKKLKDVLKENKYSISCLSRKTGIPYSTLNDIVNEKISLSGVRFGYVVLLSDALKISLEELRKMSENDKEESWEIITKSKKYFLKRLDKPQDELIYLCKANNANREFIHTIAKWKYGHLKNNERFEEWVLMDSSTT